MKLFHISTLALLGLITCWCPPNFHHYGRLCLMFASHTTKYNYSEAVQHCTRQKATLPAIESDVDFYNIYLFLASRMTSYMNHIQIGIWSGSTGLATLQKNIETGYHRICTTLTCLKSVANNLTLKDVLKKVDQGEKMPVVCQKYQQIQLARQCQFENIEQKAIPDAEVGDLFRFLDKRQVSSDAQMMAHCSNIGCNSMSLATKSIDDTDNNYTSTVNFYHVSNLYAASQVLVSGNSTTSIIPQCQTKENQVVPPISIDKVIARHALIICLRNSSSCGPPRMPTDGNPTHQDPEYRAKIYQLKQWVNRASGLNGVRRVVDDGNWVSGESPTSNEIDEYIEELKLITGFFIVNNNIRHKRAFITNETFQYELPITYSFDQLNDAIKFTKSQKNVITKILKRLEEVSCLRFKKIETADARLVIVRKKIGRTGECAAGGGELHQKSRGIHLRQGFFYIPPCVKMEKSIKNTNRTVMHEVLHALGFEHEQIRYDRDKYIRIFPDRINPDYLSQFTTLIKPRYSSYGTSYDFASIMHYKCGGFLLNKYKGTDKACTMEPLPQYKGNKFGSHELTSSDIKALNAKYCKKCTQPTMPPKSTFSELAFGTELFHSSQALGYCQTGTVPSKMIDKLFTYTDRILMIQLWKQVPLSWFGIKCNAYKNKWIPEDIKCVESKCRFPRLIINADQLIEFDLSTGKSTYTLTCLPNFYKIVGGTKVGKNKATSECNPATGKWLAKPTCKEIPVKTISNINFERSNYSGFAGILCSCLVLVTGALVAIYVLLIVKP